MTFDPFTLPTLPRPLAAFTAWPTFLLSQEERQSIAIGNFPQVALEATNGVIAAPLPRPTPEPPPIESTSPISTRARAKTTAKPLTETSKTEKLPTSERRATHFARPPKRRYPLDSHDSTVSSSSTTDLSSPPVSLTTTREPSKTIISKSSSRIRRVYPPQPASEE